MKSTVADSTDETDATDATHATDATGATDAPDAIDASAAGNAGDATDATDTTDATDATYAKDASDPILSNSSPPIHSVQSVHYISIIDSASLSLSLAPYLSRPLSFDFARFPLIAKAASSNIGNQGRACGEGEKRG